MHVEVIAMVYKSVDYLNFIAEQLASMSEIGVRIVANDPTAKVQERLSHAGVPFTIYNDPHPAQYYINRVYRCWNHCVVSSKAEKVCLVNSDMYFSDGWLEPLTKACDEGFLPTSRLVESGKMRSGTHGLSKNFGRHPREFRKEAWLKYAESIKQGVMEDGGLKMPVVFKRDEFISAGMYPEGNVYKDGIGTLNGPVVCPGDRWFFQKFCDKTGRQHKTCFNSIVYHIQEGEIDE